VESTLGLQDRTPGETLDPTASPLAEGCRREAEQLRTGGGGGDSGGHGKGGKAQKRAADAGPRPRNVVPGAAAGEAVGRFAARVSGPHCVQLSDELLDRLCEAIRER
jgi:hypothetical protein